MKQRTVFVSSLQLCIFSALISLSHPIIVCYFGCPWYLHHSSQKPHLCCLQVLPILFIHILKFIACHSNIKHLPSEIQSYDRIVPSKVMFNFSREWNFKKIKLTCSSRSTQPNFGTREILGK
ncbi:hypothetical protein BsWGS_06543 [Bradybaena similaris]